jgi:glycosyltransferase involved in cell wall biosynthesis
MPSDRLLVVCPVLPFPPIDGGRKRTLRLLEAAAADDLIPHILTTDGEDPDLVEALRGRGWTVEVLAPPPTTARHRLHQHLKRLPSPFIPSIDARLRQLAGEPRTVVQIEHTQSAYYDRALAGVPWVLSLHNVDSELLRTIAQTKRPGTADWLRSWSQWQAMRTVERREVRRAAATLCVSESDREELEAPGAELIVSPNGIDDGFFEIPLEGAEPDRVLFFGRHDYPPNEHGLARFLREGWPRVTAARPGARLRVAGSGATEEVRELSAATPGVEFIGFVDDLNAEIAASSLTVVPLWAGGGTRLKVVEGMASSRPIVGTALGVEGVGFESGRHGVIAESPRELAASIAQLLGDPRPRARPRRPRARGPLPLAVHDRSRGRALPPPAGPGPGFGSQQSFHRFLN